MPDQPLILRRGMTIVPVGNLQEQLCFLGFPLMLVDNIFGDKTEAAVRQFQATEDLEPTGVVDEETWRRMFEGEPLSLEPLGKEDRKKQKSSPERYIRIVLSLRRILLFEDDNLTANYPVAVGKPTTPTPAGEFVIIDKLLNPGGVFGTRWMAFTEGDTGSTVQIKPIVLVTRDQTAVSVCSIRMLKNFLTRYPLARQLLLKPAQLFPLVGITWYNRVILCI